MVERLIDRLTEFLKLSQGKIVYLRDIREYLRIETGSKDDTNLRTQMSTTLVKNKVVYPSGKGDGAYKVVNRVQPVRVFTPNRERRPKFDLMFPRDFNTGMELDFAGHIGIREGDLITIGGQKSMGKTTICLNFSAENINKLPVLMGNEYTVSVDGRFDPAPRFLDRLDIMSEWVEWVNDEGYDKFTLLPVREDYSEHIVAGRINIIDWVNLDGDKSYDIGKVLEGIKAQLGRGIAIIALQKGDGAVNPRGGQYVRDFSDVEILLDNFGDNQADVLMTLKGAKETYKPISGKKYAYTIIDSGTKIINFREVKKCRSCYGKGYNSRGSCEECNEKGWVDA